MSIERILSSRYGIFKDNDINNLSIKLFNDYDADDIIKFLTKKLRKNILIF